MLMINSLVGFGARAAVADTSIPLSAIQAMFSSGEKGAIYDTSDISALFQDSAGSVPVSGAGQPIGKMLDKSGNGNHAIQATPASRPLYLGAVNMDGVDDGFVVPAMPWDGSSKITVVMALRENFNTYTYGIHFAHGEAPAYSARMLSGQVEVSLVTPAFRSGPYHRRSAQVIDVSFDTVPATMAEEIIHHVDGQVIDNVPHITSRTWGNVFSSLTQYIGIWSDGASYPLNAEMYRYICINRALSEVEMAQARAWCAAAFPKVVGGYTADLNMFQITGQSLAEGGKGAPVTTAQEYNNVMFTLLENSPAAYVPAVNVTTDLESPMYGQIGHVKDLVAADARTANYQMLGCNNGVGSAPIAILGKGEGAAFGIAMSQVAAAKSIADGLGKTFKFRAVSFVQGEADNATSRADYQSAIEKLASQYNEQGKRNALQAEDVIFITSQVSSNTLPNVALAQLDAAIAHPLIYMSTPLYHFDFFADGIHLLAQSSKQLGGYMAIVYKTVLIDGKDWSPLRPLSYVKSGSDVTISMHVPVEPLVLDTTLLPAQTNYGFAAFDSGGAPISITGVALVGTDTVKITTASPIPTGGYITYAQSAQPDPARSLGGCGNLRDSQGNSLVYLGKPMHNWCVLFTQTIE